MKDQTPSELLNEIHKNANKDRERLEQYYDSLLNVVAGGDPELMVGASEGIAKLTAELTRANQQLIEIAKIKVKQQVLEMAEHGFGEEDREDIFDEFGEGLGDN